ncbi:diacylglycerol kinase-like protein [Hephaestia caeni]|uniref:Diacylglycerol kinase-like protein n=1 Tax=Hephaestia caeni TaxID=645617 RepID=A0A397NT90_9SPHN|nr:acylglycerol kinase family protein [Hephaestia caeni]RIA36631.1 diacylglycerol kinase-like protein [Hephaestia caeni]
MSNGPHAYARFDGGALIARARHDDRVVRPLVLSRPSPVVLAPGLHPLPRVGVVSNPKSHRNRARARRVLELPGDVRFETPASWPALNETLERFAAEGVDLLVVDGGDGTVRDVISAAPAAFGDRMPRMAILPSGKTNALALDLGVPLDWAVADVVEAAARGQFVRRAPIEIYRDGGGQPDVRGFLFGAGAFVRATKVAQRTHRFGAFNGLAVGLSLALGIAQTLFGTATNPWRVGERMRLKADGDRLVDRSFYLLFASTLERLPLHLKPFGRRRAGLKLLAVDAPPKRMALTVPALLAGSEAASLDRAGYRRADLHAFDLSLEGGFILDGELYRGGDITVRAGAPIDFAVP